MTETFDESIWTHEDARLLVVCVWLDGEQDAQTCAAMISLIDKAEARGEPPPGYLSWRQLVPRPRKGQRWRRKSDGV